MSTIQSDSSRIGAAVLSALFSDAGTRPESSDKASGPSFSRSGREGPMFSDSPLGGNQPAQASNNDAQILKALLALISLLRDLRDAPPSDTGNEQYEQGLNNLGDQLYRQFAPPAQNTQGPMPGAPSSPSSGASKTASTSPSSGTTYDNTFGGNQRALRDALQRQGATPEESKLAMAVQAVESNDGISHDAGKDGLTNGARNFSPLNMNEDMLRRNGVKGDLTELNTPRSPQDWDKVASAYLQVKRTDSDFINHLRNGYGGRQDTSDYKQGLEEQAKVQAEKGLGHRANHHVDHR